MSNDNKEAEAFARWLLTLTPDQRVDVLVGLKDVICFECGYEQPDERGCQCWNDE